MRPADLTALAPATLADRAGVPAGVFVTGDARGIGKVLADSDTLRKLPFTGLTELGRILMAPCAPTVKRLSLELGGNAPFVVFDDADLDAQCRPDLPPCDPFFWFSAASMTPAWAGRGAGRRQAFSVAWV